MLTKFPLGVNFDCRWMKLVTGLFFVYCSAHGATDIPPICYKNPVSSIRLFGVNHGRINEDGVLDDLVNSIVSNSDYILMENMDYLPKNGVIDKELKLVQVDAKMVNIGKVFSVDEMKALSSVFGVDFLPGTVINEWQLAMLPDAILGKKNMDSGGGRVDLHSRLIGKKTFESSIYELALKENKEVHGIENASDILKAMIQDVAALKAEVLAALELANNGPLLEAYFNMVRNNRYGVNCSSYEEYLDVFNRFPSGYRYSMAARNEIQFEKSMSYIKSGGRASILVGAAHIAGPSGLAKRFESAGFEKIDCSE